jgi:hypothetical protein
MRASWKNRPALTRGEKYALLGLIAAAIVIFILPSLITAALADGYEPGQPGYSSYKDQGSSYSNSYRHEPTAARKGHIKDYLTAEEKRILKKIHKKAVARRNGKVIVRKGKVKPIARYDEDDAEPAPIRYDRGKRTESLYVVSDRRECRAPIEVTGHERLGRDRAAKSAYNAWRTTAADRHGFRWANVENARGSDLDCTKIRGNTFGVFVCSLRARPCRDF